MQTVKGQTTRQTEWTRSVAENESAASLTNPATWAALIASGAAWNVKERKNLSLRLCGDTDTSDTESQVGEIWVLRAANGADGRAMARKIANFTAATSGPTAVAGKNPYTEEADAGIAGVLYAADQITLTNNTRQVRIDVETQADGVEAAIEIDTRGVEYIYVPLTSRSGTIYLGLTDDGE